MPNIAENLSATARLHPDHPALRFGDAVTTYAELDEAVSRVAGALRADGLVPGDRVALMLPNVPAFVALYYGVLRAGGVVVPMNPLLKEGEIRHCLADSGAVRLFAHEDVAQQAAAGIAETGIPLSAVGADLTPADEWAPMAEPSARNDGDLAALLYTSGTTGLPKGAALTHGNLGSNARVLAERVVDVTLDDVMMACLPLFHAFGQTGSMNASIRRGACLVLVPRFDPARVLAMFAELGVTIFIAVPTMYNALLHHPPVTDGSEASALRVCVSGGSPLPTEVLYGFEERFGCPVAEGYGLSETSPVASFNHLDRPRKAGSIGTPIEGVEVRLVDQAGHDVAPGEVGEIAIRGANVMVGYWNRPEETAEAIPDGWFRSGDLARKDEDGYFFIVDRKKDVIIRGGYNVYPREIEEVLYEHPDVLEAAVVGVPDEYLGEEVAAAVVLTPNGRATEEELRSFVKTRVAPYKYPRRIWIVSSLPKGSTGKILKREIRLPR
ncbi:long-chain fatty acid--CoA ligase [Streptomyces sp. VRA16 Mangrove soil]|uniref:long-chain-fatty-acid--CoA ligase n=1 Tax=Streptomyces sp. VRA16 Mangrove soil TaxID=2817434 RepID=UPI001A9E36EA|nr:long-chain fatty acid--CoA ligase [Streptomyces sp. VRA16 Mangrove soil]MBO1334342.1 long-chain fatty acid--CoA ligase [Streptomyces sp. VRA16 Mangrove soil]